MTARSDDDEQLTQEHEDREHDASLQDHVPEGWLTAGTLEESHELPLSFDALFGSGVQDDGFPESCRADPLGEAAAELWLAQ